MINVTENIFYLGYKDKGRATRVIFDDKFMNLKIKKNIFKKNKINSINNEALKKLISKKLINTNNFIYKEISNYYLNQKKC